jgi:hypothetical protein
MYDYTGKLVPHPPHTNWKCNIAQIFLEGSPVWYLINMMMMMMMIMMITYLV